jgi:hypothetical protein
VWQYENHPEAVYSKQVLWTKRLYQLNPVRAGIVEKASL